MHKFLDKWVDLLMLSAGPPEGGFVPKPPFHSEHQDCALQDTHTSPIINPISAELPSPDAPVSERTVIPVLEKNQTYEVKLCSEGTCFFLFLLFL